MYNLCRSEFGVSARCIPTVHADGHEPSNLTSCDAVCRRRGFRSERFIKPPVQVALTTSYPLCVQSVLVAAAVNVGRCAIEVWVCRRVGHNSDDCDREETGIQPATVTVDKDCKWFRSARCDCVTNLATRFQNARFRDDRTAGLVYGSFLNKSELVGQTVELRTGYHWLSTKGIAVRIVNIDGAAVPGLRAIEIWGVVASDCIGETRKSVLAVCERLRVETYSNTKDESVSSRKRKRETMVTNRTDDDDVDQNLATAQTTHSRRVPNEFLDEITFEVMLQPILLPSGHNVDATTVEKHKRVEATWGRPSSDPFTGLPYSLTSKPIPNASLKARIDQFLNDRHSFDASEGNRVGGNNTRSESSLFDPKESVLVTQRQEVEHRSSPSTHKEPSDRLGVDSVVRQSVEDQASSSTHLARLRSSLDFELQQVLGVCNQGQHCDRFLCIVVSAVGCHSMCCCCYQFLIIASKATQFLFC